jgi:RHS repeat-associated protein
MNIIKQLATSVVLLAGTWSAAGQEIVEYIHTDALGSPVAVSDAAGNVTERTVYEPYGATVGTGPSDAPGFTGHVADSATGLTYMQQRYMDPQLGLFLSVDPVTTHSDPVGAFNRYWYADNNPYRFLDPDGEASKVAWLVKLTANGMRRIGRVTQEQAVVARRSGENVVADRKQIASQIETSATGGRSKQLKHSGHMMDDGSKGLPHYQTDGKYGHSFWGKIGVAAMAAAGSLDQMAEAAEYVPDPAPRPATQSDVARWNNVMGKVSEATGMPMPGVKMGAGGGFQGYFRVQGRIDSKQLAKDMDKKKKMNGDNFEILQNCH